MDAWRDVWIQERELGDSLDTLRFAMTAAAATRQRGPGDLPSLPEIRELLRLFARLPSHDTRQAVLALLRAIVGPTT